MQLETVSAGDLKRPLFWSAEGPMTGERILRRAARLAEKLPDRHAASIAYEKRDRFVTALLSLWMRGQTAVLPADVVARQIDGLKKSYPDIYFLAEDPADSCFPGFHLSDDTIAEGDNIPAAGTLPSGLDALCIFTSGSTGRPLPNHKSWGLLAASAEPIAAMVGLDQFANPSIVATVPSHHTYGFELTVLLVLCAGASVHCERAVYPADIARCLGEVPSPRVLVTTPFHLRALIESQLELPEVNRIISATAPLASEFAASVEERLNAPIFEIYGFTEAGAVASRRTVDGDAWTLRRDLAVSNDNGAMLVDFKEFGTRIPFPDFVEILDSRHIRLGDRNQDVVKVAGKRASLEGLSAQLTRIEGVEEGIFFLSSEDSGHGTISRVMAVVVSPFLTGEQIRQKLRDRIDPAFLPRRIFHVSELPRNETGKITRESLNGFIMARMKAITPAR